MSETCVRVQIGDEDYALPVRHVPEVADLGDITPVPGAPPAVLGIRNLRGEVVPVFDLASALGAAGTPDLRRIVLVEAAGRRCALAVDAVTAVTELPEAQEIADSSLLEGAFLDDGRLVGVVDVPALLDALAPDVTP